MKESNFIFKNLPKIKPYDFILAVDTYDKPICAYALFKRTVGGGKECIIIKEMKDYDLFVEEVKNMQKYFDATITGEL